MIAFLYYVFIPFSLLASEVPSEEIHSEAQPDTLFSPKELLTSKERQWLDKKQTLTYVYDPDWAPFEWKNDKDTHTGIIADILEIIKNKTGIAITPVNTNTWGESVDLVKSGKVEMFSAITQNTAREDYLNFTSKDIYSYPAVLITRFDDKTVYLDIKKDFKGKTIGIVESSGLGRYIKDNYPEIEYVELPNTQEGFTSIRNNKIDVFAINTVTAKYFIEKKGFDDLKVALKLDYIYHLKIAIRKDMPIEIISILDKSLISISEKELHDIFNKWTQAPIEKETDWQPIFKITSVFLIIVLILIGFNRRLNQKVETKTKALTHKNIELRKLLKEIGARTSESLRAKDETNKSNQSLLIQQEKLASLGRLSANVAHEINTPLGIAKTGLSFHQKLVYELKSDFKDKSLTASDMEDYIDQSEEVMNTINNNLERAIGLAQNFKYTAVDRIDDSQHEHNLCQLVSRITTSMKSEFLREKITYTQSIDQDIQITTQGSDLSQVICNLIMNAVVHAFEGKEDRCIDISAQPEESAIALFITDNGVGVSEDIRNKIFDPFVTTKRNQGGTGLGLNIVQSLIRDRLQGSIELISPPEGGTQWRITLPRKLAV